MGVSTEVIVVKDERERQNKGKGGLYAAAVKLPLGMPIAHLGVLVQVLATPPF